MPSGAAMTSARSSSSGSLPGCSMRAAAGCRYEHARGLPSRGAVLGRHQPARPGRRRPVLLRALRLADRGRDAPRRGAHYYMARIGGRDAAAISSQTLVRRRRQCGTPTSASSPPTAPQPGSARLAGGCSPSPSTVCLGADGRVRRSRGRGLLRVTARIAPRVGGSQRAWRGELQQPAHRRCRGRTHLLRRRVRLDDDRRPRLGPPACSVPEPWCVAAMVIGSPQRCRAGRRP